MSELSRSRTAVAAVTLLICSLISGCSLFVMAGKAIFGDPKMPAAFRSATGADLTSGDDRLLIICSAPHHLLSQFPSLQVDMLDRVSRQLQRVGIDVADPDDIATWLDDNGEWGDFSELADEFDARYVMLIDLRKFTHRVPESETLLQGTAEGGIQVVERLSDGPVPTRQVFDKNFRLQYPRAYPVSRDVRSDDIFTESFLDRVALHVAQHMYDHRFSETID